MTQSLAEVLPARIREMNEVIIPAYVEIIPLAPMTAITVSLMRSSVNRAVEALASGDVVEMIRAYEDIKDWQL